MHQYEISLEQTGNAPPFFFDKIEQEHLCNIHSQPKSNPQLLPETTLSVISALERNESMSSKDSMDSSSRQDNEVENLNFSILNSVKTFHTLLLVLACSLTHPKTFTSVIF